MFTITPHINALLGRSYSFYVGSSVSSALILCIPYLRDHISSTPFSYILLYLIIMYTIIKICSTSAFTSNALVLNHLVPTSQSATLNGINMFIGCIAKAIGPFFGGYVFAYTANSKDLSYPFNYHFIFFFISLIGFAATLICIIYNNMNTKVYKEGNNSNNNNNGFISNIEDYDDRDDSNLMGEYRF